MDTRTTLLAALPLVLIITVLAAVIVFAPQTNFDIRPKAAPTTPTLAPVRPFTTPTPTFRSNNAQLQPQVACTDLYKPVCGNDGVTYSNDCEATNAGVKIAYYSACAVSIR